MPKLLEEVRDLSRTRHYSYRTEEAYLNWIRQYILFHGKRHRAEMGAAEVSECPTHLAGTCQTLQHQSGASGNRWKHAKRPERLGLTRNSLGHLHRAKRAQQ
jgi:hypothetical protein